MATKAPNSSSSEPKSVAKPASAVTTSVPSDSGDNAGPSFIRRKEFVERVVTSSGLKPNQVKSALDAVLKELGDALSAGEAVNLPPLGKLSVNRQKDLKKGEVLICKLRRPAPSQKIQPALAESTEEG